jgi:hypothetical protein
VLLVDCKYPARGWPDSSSCPVHLRGGSPRAAKRNFPRR